MDFSERLKRATQRGESSRAEKAFAEAAEALTEEEQKRRHSKFRMELTEHIEQRLKELSDNLPGFKMETIVDDRGWGSGVSRDDLVMAGGKRQNLFSRLQITVSSFNEFHVVAAAAKGAVRNKEGFTRNHYQPIAEFDAEAFCGILDRWVLDYAEQYAGA